MSDDKDSVALARWTIAEFDAIDPEIHAEYRVDVSIAVRLARAVLDLHTERLTLRDDLEIEREVCASMEQERDAAYADVKRLIHDYNNLVLDNLRREGEQALLEAEVERLRGALTWIAEQLCRGEAPGASLDTECSQTDACITEWCLPCYARAALGEGDTDGET